MKGAGAAAHVKSGGEQRSHKHTAAQGRAAPKEGKEAREVVVVWVGEASGAKVRERQREAKEKGEQGRKR